MPGMAAMPRKPPVYLFLPQSGVMNKSHGTLDGLCFFVENQKDKENIFWKSETMITVCLEEFVVCFILFVLCCFVCSVLFCLFCSVVFVVLFCYLA